MRAHISKAKVRQVYSITALQSTDRPFAAQHGACASVAGHPETVPLAVSEPRLRKCEGKTWDSAVSSIFRLSYRLTGSRKCLGPTRQHSALVLQSCRYRLVTHGNWRLRSASSDMMLQPLELLHNTPTH